MLHVLNIETGLYEEYCPDNQEHQNMTRVSIKRASEGEHTKLAFDDIFIAGRISWPPPLPHEFERCVPKPGDICILGNNVLTVYGGQNPRNISNIYRRSEPVYDMTPEEVVRRVVSLSYENRQRYTGLLALMGYPMVYGVGSGPILQFNYESSNRRSVKIKITIKPERSEFIISNASGSGESVPSRIWADAVRNAVERAKRFGFEAPETESYFSIDTVFPEPERHMKMTYLNLHTDGVKNDVIRINPVGRVSPNLMKLSFAQATWLAEQFNENPDIYEIMANHESDTAVFAYQRIMDASNSYYIK